MLSFNIGTEFKTKIAKGNIKANGYVTVVNQGDWSTYCTVKDEHGNEEEYKAEELIGFGILEKEHCIFDIVEDYQGRGVKDEFGNEDVLIGLKHLTPNVRGAKQIYRFWNDCRYSGKAIFGYAHGYRYKYMELTDEQVVDILLNEILYDYQPQLQSQSCVGTNALGIDKNPNYFNGHYVLNNNKEYTMTYCGDNIYIREGNDNGWYHDKEKAGRTLYKGLIDWNRIKSALIKREARWMLKNGVKLFNKHPEILDILVSDIKDMDKFKLNSEYEQPNEE